MSEIHTVKTGDGLDSLWAISKNYSVSFQELKKLNPLIMNRKPEDDPTYGWIRAYPVNTDTHYM